MFVNHYFFVRHVWLRGLIVGQIQIKELWSCSMFALLLLLLYSVQKQKTSVPSTVSPAPFTNTEYTYRKKAFSFLFMSSVAPVISVN